MSKILIINGPNLNLLGEREQSQYGKKDYKFLEEICLNSAKKLNIDLEIRQSNIEGEIVNIIQEARNAYDGIIINAGGYSHTSVAIRDSLTEAYNDSLASDNISAFGGILTTNKIVDENTANQINELFFEILIAPDFENGALKVLKSKKNRILIKLKKFPNESIQRRTCLNGELEQDFDNKTETFEDFKVVTNIFPDKNNTDDLVLASIIAKHTKSNCIIITKNQQLIGSGMGQVSRIDALNQAINKSKKFGFNLDGASLASDAFFPFSDCVEISFKNGIKSIVQPGGSVKDIDSIDFCNKNKMSMLFSGIRHFRH